jgi:hypothetical protein
VNSDGRHKKVDQSNIFPVHLMLIFYYDYKHVEPNQTREGAAHEFASESTNTECHWDQLKSAPQNRNINS